MGKPRVVAALAVALLFGMFGAQAQAGTAAFEKVSGKPTLVMVAKAGEANNLYITYLKSSGTLELRETGDNRDFSDVELAWKDESLPGCEFKQEFDDPAYGMVSCEAAKVKRILLALGDNDDNVFTGDTSTGKNKPRVPIYARGGKGRDQLSGGLGNDLLFGDAGLDIIDGGKGNDSTFGGAGSDSISGDEQYTADRPPARGGNDLLVGGVGNDYIYPGSGRDKVKGGAGRDIVSSVADRDRDSIDCGAGRRDSLLGIDHRGYLFKEKGIAGCEIVGSGLFGGWSWSCTKRRCVATANPYAAREEESG